ncbi:hypothetical protein CYMTET_27401 [Cymbomonas tetramitiformis]|uniref:DUF4145 domain-containing protein n=1 Tax=Cymbomonas tetramitiformis TaxID=36881 RepID=A0AAE0FQI7_9CHLO|nr:hypothetical protein CYMTET_27401 [Cymbomonas tetramitiformis]
MGKRRKAQATEDASSVKLEKEEELSMSLWQYFIRLVKLLLSAVFGPSALLGKCEGSKTLTDEAQEQTATLNEWEEFEKLLHYLDVLEQCFSNLPKDAQDTMRTILLSREAPHQVLSFMVVVQSRHALELVLAHRFLKTKEVEKKLRDTLHTMLPRPDKPGLLPEFLRGPLHRLVDSGNKAVHSARVPTLHNANFSARSLISALRALNYIPDGIWQRNEEFLDDCAVHHNVDGKT